MEARFEGVRLLAPPAVDGEYVGLADGSVVHLHEYARLYAVPGLYEHIVQERLGCRSPQMAAEGFIRVVRERAPDPGDLTVLDVGAGTGLVGSLLRERGIGAVVGFDALPAAREACLRDRPGVYAVYVVGDLSADGTITSLRDRGICGLVSAGAFGGTHAPPSVLVRALELLPAGSPVAFTVHEQFLAPDDPAGFGVALSTLAARGELEAVARRRFRHRVTTGGEPIFYELVTAVRSRPSDA